MSTRQSSGRNHLERVSADRHPAVAAYERGAERVMSTVVAACGRTADFSERVDAALGDVLALFAAEPGLARLLVMRPYGGDEEVLLSHRRWCGRYADLLRCAAERTPEAASHPHCLETGLIGGIYFQVGRFLLAGRAEQLEDLLPDLREFVLAYYAEHAGGSHNGHSPHDVLVTAATWPNGNGSR